MQLIIMVPFFKFVKMGCEINSLCAFFRRKDGQSSLLSFKAVSDLRFKVMDVNGMIGRLE